MANTMDLTNSLAVVTNSDLTRQISELCREAHLPGPYNPQHLPTDLRSEQDSYERQMQHHLGMALSLYQKKGAELEIKLRDWHETAYFYDPKDLLKDPNWENFYPGVVISGKPYRELKDAEENGIADQKHLATLLLTGAITKKQQQQILNTAQGLVCALDPRDDLFFSEQTLEECLEKERLSTAKAINTVLGRKPYVQIRKADKREVLAKVWSQRRVEGLRRSQYLFTDWEGDDTVFSPLDAVQAFTYVAFKKITSSIIGLTKREFEAAIWDVLREATESGDEDNYYLDPRDEDTWIGLRDLAKAIRELDQEAIHYAAQDDNHEGQKWMRTVGLPTLYDGSADWWAEHPDLDHDYDAEEKGELLVTKSNRSNYEEMVLFRLQFWEKVKGTELLPVTQEKYGPRLDQVLHYA